MPAPSHEVIEYACELLGRTPPPIVEFEDANLAPMTRSFYMDNRRVRNDKIRRELNVELKYPDFRAGLRGCLEAERSAADEDKVPTQKGAVPLIFKS
jgi:nucleoside-diphosphate-sugar epimerase